MSPQSRDVVERAIDQMLLDQWDPLGVKADPAKHDSYTPYAHEVFGLLARGASDVQIARALHRIESDELHHPELAARDLTPLVRALRRLESQM